MACFSILSVLSVLTECYSVLFSILNIYYSVLSIYLIHQTLNRSFLNKVGVGNWFFMTTKKMIKVLKSTINRGFMTKKGLRIVIL